MPEYHVEILCEGFPPVSRTLHQREFIIGSDAACDLPLWPDAGLAARWMTVRLKSGWFELEPVGEPDAAEGIEERARHEFGRWIAVQPCRIRIATRADGATGATASADALDGSSIFELSGESARWAEPEFKIVLADGETLTYGFPDLNRELVIGRDSAAADLIVRDAQLDPRHARLFRRDEQAMIEDLGTEGGTWAGQTRLSEPIALRHLDEIRIGETKIVYVCYRDLLEQTLPADDEVTAGQPVDTAIGPEPPDLPEIEQRTDSQMRGEESGEGDQADGSPTARPAGILSVERAGGIVLILAVLGLVAAVVWMVWRRSGA